MIQVAIEKYKKVQDLNWNETEKISGKKIKIKGFPRDKKVKMFWIIVISNKNGKLFMHQTRVIARNTCLNLN